MTGPAPIVHVVDDDDSLRRALARLLRAAGFEVRDYASAGAFLLARPPEAPGCLVLDVRMPGPSGLELQAGLARDASPLPVVFLSGHGDVATSVQAMKAGAVDFLTKPVDREALLGAVRRALSRDADERATRARRSALRARYAALTAREREVLAGVVAGRLNKQIAADLGTSERTVKGHRARLMEKMGADSLADLVRLVEEIRAAAPAPR